jgi:signal transduction histidine kinase/ActR/RegA family two-component response regulator
MIPQRSREFINAAALIVAVTIGVGAPAGLALDGRIDEVATLSLRTRLNAARVGKFIYSNEQTWRFQAVRLAELIENTDPTSRPIHQRLLDATGRVVVEEEGIVPWPPFELSVPVVVGDQTVAVLEASTSARPLLIETAIVAVIASLIGFGAWIAVRLLPLRALDAAMTELIEQNTLTQAAIHEADLLREKERAAAEANKAKSGFLAMMSHEIRTPMNAVLGLAGSLLDGDLPPAQREVVEAIRDSGDDLLRILNDILDFSKLDASKMTFEAAAFAPAALTNSVVSILSSRATAKRLRIVAETDPALPNGVLGDAGRIRQVLVNLVSNAIKFTPSGQVTVATRCLASDASSATIEWVVSDSGIGIAADRIASLFSEFTQADNSITRRFGGTGLGLAISKRLVTQMDGTIDVESTPGHGTTFRVRLILPIALAPTEQPRQRTSVVTVFQDAVKRFGRTPRVLFAEDNPTNQFVARQLLKDLDIQIDMVGDGLEAVDQASRFAYDVICMDVQMPEMDGLEATRLIRALCQPFASVPIIALTANAFPEDVRACLAAGMNQFVAKPVSRETLLNALMQALSETTAAGPQAREQRIPATATE